MSNAFHSRSPADFRDEAQAVLRLCRHLRDNPGRDVVLYPEPQTHSAWLGDLDPESLPNGGGVLTVYTSGTTGAPQAREHAIEGLFAVNRPAAADGAKWLLCYQPWRWAGLSVIRHVVCTGAELVIPDSLSPLDLVKAFAQATHLSLTPSLLRKLALTTSFTAPNIAQVTLGGEWASQAALDLARSLFPNARISHVYASTEFGDICSASDGMAGFPAERIRGGALADDGELLIHGRPTGDLWELRDRRYFFIGRKAEQISVGGALVAASVIEDAALALPGVAQARAFGVPNAILGQVIALEYVGSAGLDELKAHLSQRLPKSARPMRVAQVAEIALSPAGKLSRTSAR